MIRSQINLKTYAFCSQDQQLVRQMLAAVAVRQVQGPRQEQEGEEEPFANVKQLQRRELREEQVELAQEACGDSTLTILQELKCK